MVFSPLLTPHIQEEHMMQEGVLGSRRAPVPALVLRRRGPQPDGSVHQYGAPAGVRTLGLAPEDVAPVLAICVM